MAEAKRTRSEKSRFDRFLYWFAGLWTKGDDKDPKGIIIKKRANGGGRAVYTP